MIGSEFMKAFVNQYLGRGLDFDGSYGVQCVDGAKIGMMLLGCTSPPTTISGYATGYWYYYDDIPYLRNNYTKIPNPSNVQVGDMLIFSTPSPTGHVGWAYENGQVFGQNQDGNNDAFSLRPVSNWTFLGALRFNGFDGVSQPVYGFDGENQNYDYQETDAENFRKRILSSIGKKPIYYRKPYIYLKVD